MTRQFKFAGLAVSLLVGSQILARAQIESATILTAQPRLFCRVDFVIMLTASWTISPYRAEEVRLDFDLISPSGKTVMVPAYFERGKSGYLSVWKVRVTPEETGEYRGEFVLTNGANHSVSSNISFTVASSHQKGFLRDANDWTFRFDNGEPFRGIGENIGWESRSRDDSRFFGNLNESPRYNYEYMLGRLAADGGNFFRTWMCPWNLPLEWKTVSNTNRYSDDAGYFNASAISRMDKLVDLASSLDFYMMLTLDNSGEFQGWGWRHNNYNQVNGGPAANPQDFFTDPGAKAQYKDRLRYLVARWGYSPHIAAWEFFNEVDNLMYGLPQKIPDDVITSWHKEMSEYLKSIDPYHHLVTTSVSHRHVAGLYRIPTMDFNQIHIYGHDGLSRTATFPQVLRDNSRRYGKPFVIGEFGFEWDWHKNFDDFAPEMDADFKKGLWLGLFSPTPVLPMSWWWEYFDRRGTTPYISCVRSVLNQMLAAGEGSFADIDCQWSNPTGKALAVRCGDTFFVLLTNGGNTAATGDVSLPLPASKRYEVRVFDPESNTTKALPTLAPGAEMVKHVCVPSTSELVLIISPE